VADSIFLNTSNVHVKKLFNGIKDVYLKANLKFSFAFDEKFEKDYIEFFKVLLKKNEYEFLSSRPSVNKTVYVNSELKRSIIRQSKFYISSFSYDIIEGGFGKPSIVVFNVNYYSHFNLSIDVFMNHLIAGFKQVNRDSLLRFYTSKGDISVKYLHFSASFLSANDIAKDIDIDREIDKLAS
jgi:hypothetical protein